MVITDAELAEMLERATDGRGHEWGWYRDDVPRLIAALREARRQVAWAERW